MVQETENAESNGNLLPEWAISKKWGIAVSGGEYGFQAVPDLLLRKQNILGITNTEMLVLLNITLHWWEVEKLPHPRPSNIAKRMGMTTRSIERAIISLEKKGVLERKGNQKTEKGYTARHFELKKLVKKLEDMVF